MIKLFSANDKELKLTQSHFPDHTQMLRVNTDAKFYDPLNIQWTYEEESELATLIYLTRYLQENTHAKLILTMPYLPNARMDRVNNSDEVFTLKYFAEIINSLHFDEVRVLDLHSNVSRALINHLKEIDVTKYIQKAIDDYKPDILFMPDEGAHKRYSGMFNLPSTFGIKIRDWRSGEIKDYHLADPALVKDKRVLIIDDICSRGGTFYHAGQLLNKMSARDIGLYISHCEETIKDGNVLDPTKSYISQVYTADPLWRNSTDAHVLAKSIKVIKA